MSSRAEEKERRRREREAAQQELARANARRRMVRFGAIGLGVVVIAIVAVVALAGGGDDSSANSSALAADAAAAGCEVRDYESEGRDHTDDQVTYETNPPTSGPHNPVPAQDGIYPPGNEPAKENVVHTLEHGRIVYQYKPGTSDADIQKLRSLVSEEFEGSAGYHQVLMQNNTDMPANFAAVAWTHALTCSTLTPQALEAMRDFREVYVDKAPELIP